MTAPLHMDTGVLALDAMPEDESAEALAHVETCESCTVELVGFRETAALLGSAVAEVPPASLRRSVMTAIAVTPQLPPITARHAVTEPLPPPVRESADDQPDNGPDNVVPLRPWYRRPASLIAAAVAALVIGGGAIVAINQTTGTGQETAQSAEQCVAQAADKLQLTPQTGASAGTATYAASCNAVTLDVTGLPDLPDDKTYQLWAIADNQPRSVTLLTDASEGKQQIYTAETKPGESVMAISTEPAGGSPAPTTEPLWVAPLPA
jgi:anti-sigma-K factor RskA